jgi:hypothetical protein
MPRPAILPRTSVRWHLAILATLGLLLLLAAPAAAHERRQAGGHSFVVGFGDEPAYAGEKNSVQVMVTDGAGQPVRNADGLEVMVMAGGRQTQLKLEPHFGDTWGTPGDYRAFFIPTAAGRYTFHLEGTIAGKRIRPQRFTSGPDTFSDVEDPAKVAFPLKSPTTAQLAERVDREVPRLNAALQGAQAAQQQAADAARRARDAAGQARLLAIAGLLVGAAGMVVAGLALARRPAAPPIARHDHDVVVGAGKV